MGPRLALAALVLSISSCSVPDLDLEGRPCPCASGYRCNLTTNICVRDVPDASLPDADLVDAQRSDSGNPQCDCWTALFRSSDRLSLADVGIDAEGNVYYTGSAAGEVELAGTPFSTGGSTHLIAGSVDSAGAPRWAAVYGSEYADGREIAVEASGRSSIIGAQSSTATYGSIAIDARSRQDVVLIVHDADGNVTRATSFPGETGNAQGKAIAGSNGVIAFAGQYNDDLFIDRPLQAVSVGDEHGYAAVFDVDSFMPVWSRAYPLSFSGAVFADGAAIDATNNTCFAGNFDAPTNFGGANVNPIAGQDGFVTRHDATGAWVADAVFGSGGDDAGLDAALSPGGDCIVVGVTAGSTTFDTMMLPGLGGRDGFVGSIDAAGRARFANTIGGTGTDIVIGADIAMDGTIYVTGAFSGDVDIFGSSLSSAGDTDVFVLALSENGNPSWLLPLGGIGSDSASGIVVSSDGSTIVVSGCFEEEVDFGSMQIRAAAGDTTCFIHRFAPAMDPRLVRTF